MRDRYATIRTLKKTVNNNLKPKPKIKTTFTRTFKLLLITLFFISNGLFAQDVLQPDNEKTYTEYVDKVLEPLLQNDVSLYKNSILYDRVFPMASLHTFNNPDSLNKYQVIDPCDPENPQFVDVSELYDLYGVKLQNIEPQQDIIDVENTGSSGEIRIIKVESNGKVATKRVIVD